MISLRRGTRWIAAALAVTAGAVHPTWAQPVRGLDSLRARLLEGDAGFVVQHLGSVPDSIITPSEAFVLGKAWLALSRLPEALGAFRRADTTRTATRLELASALDRMGAPSEAASVLEVVVSEEPGNRAAALHLARLYGEADEWPSVVATLRPLLVADPDNASVHAQMGVAFARQDSSLKAIVHFERALKSEPGHVRAAVAVSGLYVDRNLVRSARATLDRALRHRPGNVALLRRSAEVALQEGAYGRALSDLRLARTLGDRSVPNMRNMGVAAYLMDSLLVARTELVRAWEIDSSSAMGALYLGMLFARSGDLAEAIRLLNRSAWLAGLPFVADVFVRLGSVHQNADRLQEAIDAFALAERLDPSRGDIAFFVASLHDSDRGDRQVALAAYERFLGDPAHARYPELAETATRRIRQIKEVRFLEEGRAAAADSLRAVDPPPR